MASSNSPPAGAAAPAAPADAASTDELSSQLANLTVGAPADERVTLETIARRIASGEIRRVLVMSGAGISVSAGIPDFRSPGTGLYDNLARYNLPRPTAVFELDYFRSNPAPFFLLAKELYPSGQYRPTPAHFFIKLLEERGLLQRSYSQNIDGLDYLTGLSEEKVIQAHGGFQRAACIECARVHTQEYVKEHVFADRIPHCEADDCDGLVKPSITFFGEDLPRAFHEGVKIDFPFMKTSKADLLIVMGTSLQVQPFASLIDRVAPTCLRLLINNECVGAVDEEDITARLNRHPHYYALRQQMNFLKPGSDLRTGLKVQLEAIRKSVVEEMGGFNFESGRRDVFLESDCDAGVRQLAALIGVEFASRLEQLIAEDRVQHPNAVTKTADAAAVVKVMAEAVGTKPPVEPAASSTATAAPVSSLAPSQVTAVPTGNASSVSGTATSSPVAVALDFDHTLGFDHGLELNALQQYLTAEFDVPPFEESRKKEVEVALNKFRNGQTTQEEMLRSVGTIIGLSEEQQDHLSLSNYRDLCCSDEFVGRTTAAEGARDLLRWLHSRGVPTAILTNGWSPLQPRKIAHALGNDAPQVVLVSDDPRVGAKPSRAAFDALAACPPFAGMPRSHLVYVGDNPTGDVVGAMAAGFVGVWLDADKESYPVDQPQPSHTIHKLADLRSLIEERLAGPTPPASASKL